MPVQTNLDILLQDGLMAALKAHQKWEDQYPAFEADETLQISDGNLQATLEELSKRLHGENYPFFHPLYAGQMLKPPHPAAIIGYLSAMLINPNNHALDGGPPTARMETECIDALARSFGFENWLGHLTASGTIANMEALWVARELHPDKIVVYSEQSHYTHKRMCDLLKIKSVAIPSNPDGSMNLEELQPYLKTRKIGTLVATLGTTSLGAIDSLGEIMALAEKHEFRVHVDAAYGGYYHLLRLKDPAFYHFNYIGAADSVVIDPHKHGLQPYGCGCVIFRDPDVARLYAHESPYTYFTSPDRHPGEITLECSRPGAAAAALWTTMQLFPLNDLGMGLILEKTRAGALAFADAIERSPRLNLFMEPALDIVTYYPCAPDTESVSALTNAVFEEAMKHPESPVFTAKLNMGIDQFRALHPEVMANSDQVTILRSCLMKPEHSDWVSRVIGTLEESVVAANKALTLSANQSSRMA